LDAEKRACIEVTYFSPNSSLTLTVGNKVSNGYTNEVTLLVSATYIIFVKFHCLFASTGSRKLENRAIFKRQSPTQWELHV
jgi:hypothetical protein